MATHYSSLAKESYEQGNLTGYSPWGHKGMDMNEMT